MKYLRLHVLSAGRARNLALATAAALASVLCGCGSQMPYYSHFNEPLMAAAPAGMAAHDAAAGPAARPGDRLALDGRRGNPKVLVFLALSGGGSRSAYFSTAVMDRLSTVFDDIDLLAEVDAMSSVSGGSIAAGYYAATHDDHLRAPALAQRLDATLQQALAEAGEAAPARRLRARFGTLGADGVIRCAPSAAHAAADAAADVDGEPPGAAEARDWAWLRARWQQVPQWADRLERLCGQAELSMRTWNGHEARQAMQRNYIARWIGNWLWPANFLRYWFTAYDRTDIMAQTLADNLYDSPWIGRDLRLGDLNPTRPDLVINATNATEAGPHDDGLQFGSVFTYTDADFRQRLGSDVKRFPLARAVMASSAFPFVFATSTLCDYRTRPQPSASDACDTHRFLHVFDGGNADNLGLRSIKRGLLEMAEDGRLNAYDRIIVLQVDAFARPRGAGATRADPRSLLSLLLDTNVTDAVDSLLQTNRAALLSEFDSAALNWREKDCRSDSRQLPRPLCDALAHHAPSAGGTLDLSDRLVFYHIGFHDLTRVQGDREALLDLRGRIEQIGTSLSLDKAAARDLDRAAELIIRDDNACLQQLRRLVQESPAADVRADVRTARGVCRALEGPRDDDANPPPASAGGPVRSGRAAAPTTEP